MTLWWTVPYMSKPLMLMAVVMLVLAARRQAAVALGVGAVSDAESPTYTGPKANAKSLVAAGSAVGGAVMLTLIAFGLPTLAAGGIGLVMAAIVPRFLAKRRRRNFQEAFDKSLAEALGTVSSSLKAGLTLREALAVAAQNTPPVFAAEITVALKQYRFGVALDEVLDGVRRRVATASANIAFGAMIIGSQLGGNLPEILKRIVVTIRERDRVEGRLRALTAQGRSQAFLLCGAPIVIGIGLWIWDPAKMEFFASTPTGKVLLALAIVLELLGIVVTKKVMTLEI
jgi:tight adherence protein B